MEKNNIFSLVGKVAVVTGAKGKLGRVWVETLKQAGAKVAELDLPEADVTNKASLEVARQMIEADLGVVDILINNAGIDQPPNQPTKTFLLEDFSGDIFKQVLDVNVVGAFYCMQVFGKSMVQQQHGSIINIGSLYASVSPDARFYDHLKNDPPFLKPPVYGASKAALVQLTKYFATHWGDYNVRVNTLSPGGIEGGQDSEFKRKFNERVPLGRMGSTTDLVGPLLFLASDASGYMTGQELIIDGGFTAW
ncbi:MAG: SDR family oxidoreductase [Patescibacteria group bacterium]|jgi:NAD(P)-dependent dehydrogenase (short-subunit alcohol dehydrogenase family)